MNRVSGTAKPVMIAVLMNDWPIDPWSQASKKFWRVRLEGGEK